MNAQKKLGEADIRIRELTLRRDDLEKKFMETTASHRDAMRQVAELRAENAALKQLFQEFHTEIMVQTAGGREPNFSEANEIYRKFLGLLK